MFRCPCGEQYATIALAMACCDHPRGRIRTIDQGTQVLGAVEFAAGVATGDRGEETAGLLMMGGMDAGTANVIGAIEDAFEL